LRLTLHQSGLIPSIQVKYLYLSMYTLYMLNYVFERLILQHVDENLVKKVVTALKNSGLIAPAGILTSLTNSGQQW